MPGPRVPADRSGYAHEGPRKRAPERGRGSRFRRIDPLDIFPTQQSGDHSERPSQRVPPGLSSNRGFPRGGCSHRPPTFDFPTYHVRAIRGFVVNRRPVEPLDGPASAAEDPIPLPIVLVTHSLVVSCAIRFYGKSNVWESEIHVISMNVKLGEWGQSFPTHGVEEGDLDQRHPDRAVRCLDAHRARPSGGLSLHATVDGGPLFRPCQFPPDHTAEVHRVPP